MWIARKQNEGNDRGHDGGRPHARWIGFLFGFVALLVLPLYTYNFASTASLLHCNMSMIGGSMGKYKELLCWGIVSSASFASMMSYVFSLAGFENRRVRLMMYAACTLLVLALTLPYVPEVYPVMSLFHTAFAMGASAMTIGVMLLFVLHLAGKDRALYRKALVTLCILIGFSGILLFSTGLSGLLETVFVTSVSVFLFSMYLWLQSIQRDALEPARRQGSDDETAGIPMGQEIQ